jgi:hypothetical protein
MASQFMIGFDRLIDADELKGPWLEAALRNPSWTV